jgi:hypothetical protein
MIISISFSLGLKNSAGTVPAFREKILPKRNSGSKRGRGRKHDAAAWKLKIDH